MTITKGVGVASGSESFQYDTLTTEEYFIQFIVQFIVQMSNVYTTKLHSYKHANWSIVTSFDELLTLKITNGKHDVM